jgi:predicted O-linked N-acetylglucosamine transferase (SPINDLY family)
LEVVTFLIGGGVDSVQFDRVQQRIVGHSAQFFSLPIDDVAACATAIRSANVDVLIYPEVGIDLTTYFLTFARLAPVQVVWFGHPDTTGVHSVDYYVTSDVEIPGAEHRYTEKLHRMRSLGTVFEDNFAQSAALQRDSPRTVLLIRARFTESVHLPKGAHLYVVQAPLNHLHFSFDDVLRLILLKDRLGYVIMLNNQQPHDHWKRKFFERWSSHSVELETRVLFVVPRSDEELSEVLLAAHVLLDPFPVTGEHFLVLLHALSIGLPVITMPSSVLGGRMALALYNRMDYGMHNSPGAAFGDVSVSVTDLLLEETAGSTVKPFTAPVRESSAALVVHDVHDYVTMALRLTHQPKLRAHHSVNLLDRRHLLFGHDQAVVLADWEDFIHSAVANSSTYVLNTV